MQEFTQWMTALQHHEHSPASSYAETDSADSDCDSDNSYDECQCRLDAKRKFVAKDTQRVWTRTAPISIPSTGQRHPHLCQSVVESPDLSYHADMRLLRAGRYLHEDQDQDALDEDDPAFYGNLAYFRSQHGASQTLRTKRNVYPFKTTSAPASPTSVDACDDEDIFAMEL
ncbi:Hypothetical protein PHPALM_17644 [Phytophthora palmivora]|uniref:Uncharacterized protein n=1 Tax=Phytophthora palmivora TaxID=4796 RepID=A0A2P4XLW9_9STRA|nr:Hypothetical protein PHPALM_17644 [Phytophthora palmivora]